MIFSNLPRTYKKLFLLISFLSFFIIFSEYILFLNWKSLKRQNKQRVKAVEALINSPSNNPTIAGVNQKLIPVPYGLYRFNPKYISPTEPKIRQFDEFGYRNKVFDTNKNCFRVLALGGSTTVEYPYVKKAETWTSYIQKEFENSSNKIPLNKDCIQVFNAGLSNGTSAELLSDYVFRAYNLKPNLIIIHTGGNDGVALRQKNYSYDYSHLRASNNGELKMFRGNNAKSRFLRFIGKNSYIVRHYYAVVHGAKPI